MADPAFPPPFRPSAVVVRHRFVSASHLAGRIRRLHEGKRAQKRVVDALVQRHGFTFPVGSVGFTLAFARQCVNLNLHHGVI